jgi:pimeloyl-ACP methyl ester carboxylesterase
MPRPIRKPKRLRLYKALRIGYLNNERKQAKRLKAFGYVLDNSLTTNRHLVAYNPTSKKVIFVSRGTDVFSPQDLATDTGGIGLNRLQNTMRYKQDFTAYTKAKEKYQAPITLVGHSLGGAIVSNLAQAGDRAITYNAANLYQKRKPNVYAYRTAGDLISLGQIGGRTLENTGTFTERLNPLQAHNLSNIRDAPIFV